jgi:hypothetical protein
VAASLEIHIPISPAPSFFTMIHYFAASLRLNGGILSEAPIIVSVGEDCEPYDIAGTLPHLDSYNISWRWTDRALFREHSYAATRFNRYAKPFKSDFVLMADSDMIINGDFSNLLQLVAATDGYAGVIATWPPFLARGEGNVDRERWAGLYRTAGLQVPPFSYRHPGYNVFYGPDEGIADTPIYYNYGFVLATRRAVEAVTRTFFEDFLIATEYMKTDLVEQAGLGLSIVRNGIHATALPVRYNFWNHEKYVSGYPEDLDDLRVLHYLHHGVFAKQHDIDNPQAIARWLEAHKSDPDPVARLMTGALQPVHERVMSDF